MKLLTRRLRPDDFSACWPLVLHRARFSVAERAAIQQAWITLLPADAMRGVVIFDAHSPDQQVVAFGASVFVSREWMEATKRQPTPFFGIRTLIQFDQHGTAILREAEIARENAGAGLNLVVVHSGWASDGIPGLAAAGSELVSGFQDCHAGFRLREIISEIYGAVELEFCTQGGSWSEYSRYDAYFHRQPEHFPTEENEPIMLDATVESCALASPLWCMFQFAKPVLRLSRRQQRVLLLASEGLSNPDIAFELQLAAESVRNSFRSAYEKVSGHPVYCRTLDAVYPQGSRLSKRDRLVSLFKNHKEELRPWDYRQPAGLHAHPRESDWFARVSELSAARAKAACS